MCGRPKRDPRVDEEQRKAREAAELAKAQALEEQEKKRREELEMQKAKADTLVNLQLRSLGKSRRQSEFGELDTSGVPMRSFRAGSSGRRSLITSSGGGAGYFSRFL